MTFKHGSRDPVHIGNWSHVQTVLIIRQEKQKQELEKQVLVIHRYYTH